LWRHSASSRTLGENPRSPDRVVAALLRHDLLEDVTLELSSQGRSQDLRIGGAKSSSIKTIDKILAQHHK
jgi:hypothetical protein